MRALSVLGVWIPLHHYCLLGFYYCCTTNQFMYMVALHALCMWAESPTLPLISLQNRKKKNIVFPSECSFMMYVNINFILSIVICFEYFEHFFMILFFLQLFLVCISNSKPFYHHSGIKTTQVLNRKFPSKSNFIQ